MADTSKWKWMSRNSDWKKGLFPWGTPGNVINLFGRIVTGDCERHHYCGYVMVDPHALQRRCRDIPKDEFWDAWNQLIQLPHIFFEPKTCIMLVMPLWERWLQDRGSNVDNFANLIRSICGTLRHARFDPDDRLEFPFKELMWPGIASLYDEHEGDSKHVDLFDVQGELESAIDTMAPHAHPPMGDPVGDPVGDPLKSESPKIRNPVNPENPKAGSRVKPGLAMNAPPALDADGPPQQILEDAQNIFKAMLQAEKQGRDINSILQIRERASCQEVADEVVRLWASREQDETVS